MTKQALDQPPQLVVLGDAVHFADAPPPAASAAGWPDRQATCRGQSARRDHRQCARVDASISVRWRQFLPPPTPACAELPARATHTHRARPPALCRGQRDPAGRGGRRPVELPLFEPLRQHAKANAVMPDRIDQSGATATEGIQSSIEGVLCQALLHQHRQANGTFPHVRDPARQVDASTWRKCRSSTVQRASRTRRKTRAIHLGVHAHRNAAEQHDLRSVPSDVTMLPATKSERSTRRVPALSSCPSSCCQLNPGKVRLRSRHNTDLVTQNLLSPRVK